MTEKELVKLAEERSYKDLGRLSPAFMQGYIKGFHESEECHQPVEIPLN